jgi:hypothetical protein
VRTFLAFAGAASPRAGTAMAKRRGKSARFMWVSSHNTDANKDDEVAC